MKVSEASHGQIISGKGPDLFLDSIGARAATLYDPVSGDSHILMKDNFDLSNAEDQSEYGHELVHVAKSGGIAGAKINDAEEKLAQSVESMIFTKPVAEKATPFQPTSKISFKVRTIPRNQAPQTERPMAPLPQPLKMERLPQHLAIKPYAKRA